MQKLIIKKGREKPLLAKHHWIFSGAISKMPSCEAGSLVIVESEEGRRLGIATTNPKGSLAARMIAFGDSSAEEAIDQAIIDSVNLRQSLVASSETNAYRLINGEGDRLPGLIVDRYDQHLVIQVGTHGMEKLKPYLIKSLLKACPDTVSIMEKSDLPTRKQEGLEPFTGPLFGHTPAIVPIKENGHHFLINILEGQKTGFFLDQRPMRQLIGQLSHERTVLNCFSYTGGFSIYALQGGARKVRSVDISKKAIQSIDDNLAANQLQANRHEGICRDVFEFLKEDRLDDDIVILDPPAFAKKKEDVVNACRGYKEINRTALKKMKKGSLLLTASCSYHVDETLFQQVIFQACSEAMRNVKIITKHQQAIDHAVNIYHKEGEYLKSLLLYID